VLGYRCLSCGREIDERGLCYTCPACGGNLEVVFDGTALARAFPSDRAQADLGRYHGLCGVAPDYRPALPVRTTPLRAVRGRVPAFCDVDVWLKDETGHASGSFKDRASYVVLAKALEWGMAPLVGASTGNAGASMACLCAAAGVPATIFVPAAAPPAKLAQLFAYGADLRRVDGTYDVAYEASLQVTRERGWLNRNTGFNPWTREGKKTVSFELFEQLGRTVPDWIVVPVGDGNILSGVWKGWRDLRSAGLIDRLPRLLAAQAEGSDAITRAYEARRADPGLPLAEALRPVETSTLADSISVGLPRDGVAALAAIEQSGGHPLRVTDDAIVQAVLDVARGTGVFLEPAAAAGAAALAAFVASGGVGRGERVVLLGTGSGLKDVRPVARLASEASPS
jgi:threonine synthase